VEAVLYSHPAVHQAAVFGLPSRVMGELVGAAVTLRPDAAAQASSVVVHTVAHVAVHGVAPYLVWH
jgi:acyl-CoA synthetase (AMP-forming)/AMP-acid ligase II